MLIFKRIRVRHYRGKPQPCWNLSGFSPELCVFELGEGINRRIEFMPACDRLRFGGFTFINVMGAFQTRQPRRGDSPSHSGGCDGLQRYQISHCIITTRWTHFIRSLEAWANRRSQRRVKYFTRIIFWKLSASGIGRLTLRHTGDRAWNWGCDTTSTTSGTTFHHDLWLSILQAATLTYSFKDRNTHYAAGQPGEDVSRSVYGQSLLKYADAGSEIWFASM